VPGAEVVLGDLADPESLTHAALGTGGIVHAACTFQDSAIDVAAMRALLSAWTAGPFVYISSLDVYGLATADPITEDTPVTDTYNDYSRGKVICERLLQEAARAAGRRDFTVLRAPYIWGPHATARRRLVSKRLIAGEPIVLPGRDAAQWENYRDAWVDARDLSTIVAESLAHPAGGPLNVLSGHFTWHDLYARLIGLTGSRSTLVHKPLDAITEDELPKKDLLAQGWRFSEERLERHLGTIPRRPLEVTLRDTIACP
jgi:nucleoside-diphosphate-sugar epimerase